MPPRFAPIPKRSSRALLGAALATGTAAITWAPHRLPPEIIVPWRSIALPAWTAEDPAREGPSGRQPFYGKCTATEHADFVLRLASIDLANSGADSSPCFFTSHGIARLRIVGHDATFSDVYLAGCSGYCWFSDRSASLRLA